MRHICHFCSVFFLTRGMFFAPDSSWSNEGRVWDSRRTGLNYRGGLNRQSAVEELQERISSFWSILSKKIKLYKITLQPIKVKNPMEIVAKLGNFIPLDSY